MEELKLILLNQCNIEVEKIKELTEGFSLDQKYVINNKYIVRVIENERVNQFKFVFETQKKFYEVAKCQKPIELIIGKNKAYFITEFLPGKDGLKMINNFDIEKQYKLGVEAGTELAKFHQINYINNFDTKTYVDELVNKKINQARADGIVKYIPVIEDIIKIVEDNKHILYNLKGVLNHSDYHLFNMIFDESGYKGVIDFERCRSGIFITDFRNNAAHNVPKSKYFASGIIDGYLDKIKINNFFTIDNLNNFIISLGAISWTLKFNKENLNNEIEYIIDLYNKYKIIDTKPKWYIGKY